nr:putative ion channel POLLUX-like 2 isoform X1 [Ipomoea batatas]
MIQLHCPPTTWMPTPPTPRFYQTSPSMRKSLQCPCRCFPPSALRKSFSPISNNGTNINYQMKCRKLDCLLTKNALGYFNSLLRKMDLNSNSQVCMPVVFLYRN